MIYKKLKSLYEKRDKYVIGLMSGTSLDGIDTVLLKVRGYGKSTKFDIVEFETYPFAEDIKKLIKSNSEFGKGNVSDICYINFLIPHLYFKAIEQLCRKAKVNLSEIDLIGSHGQTIHHLPKKKNRFGVKTGSTLQVGDPSVLAKLTGVVTIGDFRVGDVALWGEGAPLVPYFDYLFFSSEKENIGLLNIGGISNITILEKGKGVDSLRAFDTGPGNILIDYICRKLFKKPFDEGGKLAVKGKISLILMDYLTNIDKNLRIKPPKSTGREYYGEAIIDKLLNEFSNFSKYDVLRTITEYTTYSIYYNYKKYIVPEVKIDKLYVSGGGAHNPLIMNSLKDIFGRKVSVSKIEFDNRFTDAKEAVCFGILANELIGGNATNVPSVTGARRPTLLGKICLP